jgi:P-type conjugative transfer protein TrbJ
MIDVLRNHPPRAAKGWRRIRVRRTTKPHYRIGAPQMAKPESLCKLFHLVEPPQLLRLGRLTALRRQFGSHLLIDFLRGISIRRGFAVSVIGASLAVAAPTASAQWIVFDPQNFSQNVLTAARELQQISNQIQMLTNQATMLTNQARNLANLPMSTLTQLQSSIARTQSLLSQAQNVAFNVQRVQQAYSTSYGSAAGSGSTTAMVAAAQTRWQNSVAAFEDSLKIQAGVVGNIPTNSGAMTSLVSASQNATGALQAAQAGNQLLALQSQQLSDLVAVVSGKGRADALEQARIASAEAQGQQQYGIFSTRSGYIPGNVTMFSGQ